MDGSDSTLASVAPLGLKPDKGPARLRGFVFDPGCSAVWPQCWLCAVCAMGCVGCSVGGDYPVGVSISSTTHTMRVDPVATRRAASRGSVPSGVNPEPPNPRDPLKGCFL